MGEDWIARGIAAVAAIAAVVNSIITYRKYKSDQQAALPKVGWVLTKLRTRQYVVEFSVTNTKPHPIELKGLAIGAPIGARLSQVKSEDADFCSRIGLSSKNGDSVGFIDRIVPANESTRFNAKVVIDEEQPAPRDAEALFVLVMDLRDGSPKDHRFEFRRKM